MPYGHRQILQNPMEIWMPDPTAIRYSTTTGFDRTRDVQIPTRFMQDPRVIPKPEFDEVSLSIQLTEPKKYAASTERYKRKVASSFSSISLICSRKKPIVFFIYWLKTNQLNEMNSFLFKLSRRIVEFFNLK